MKNKKLFLGIGIFLVVVLLGVGIFFIVTNNNDNGSTPFGVTTDDEPAVEGASKTTNLKSNLFNQIEKDSIEATNIQINHFTTDLQVLTTLKNKTDETITGFFIRIDLLDKDGNTVTTIAENSKEKIDANGEITITNYVSGIEYGDRIVDAKIVSLDKNNIRDSIENAFDEMEASVPIDESNDSSSINGTEEIKATVPVQ